MTESAAWFENDESLLRQLRERDAPRAAPPRIAGYSSVEELRRGGQGIVYTATQESTGRRVAIKVLFEDALSPDARRRRFEREIELVCALEHPDIVRVYDSGVTDLGQLFFVMELVDGEEISATTTGDAPRTQRLELFARVCRAVHHAHQRGVIHRDLKPSNILVDSNGAPRVLDFGVARPPLSRDVDKSSPSTHTGQFVGTLAYASPEQLSGEPSALDVRSDVYSLGVMLYELLTGRSPYATDGSMLEVVRAITEAEPARPGIDRELDAVLLKALAKSPERRYQSAAALADELESYLSGRPVEARRDSKTYVLVKLLKRHRLAFGAGSLFVLLLVAFGISMSVLYGRATLEARKLEQSLVFLEDTFGSVEKSDDGEPVSVRSLLDEAVHWIAIALDGEPEVEASIRVTLGNGYRGLGLFDEARTQLLRARELHEKHLPSDEHPDHARSLNALGLLYRDLGRLDRAEEYFLLALGVRKRAFGDESVRTSASYQNLASIETRRGDSHGAIDLLAVAHALRSRHYGDEHPDTAMTLFQLAQGFAGIRQWHESLERHEKALLVRRKTLHPAHPDIVRSLEAIAEVEQKLLRYGAARKRLKEALATVEETRGPSHPWATRLKSRLADLAEEDDFDDE